MSWSERLQILEQEAQRTHCFSFSAYSHRLYFRLQNAIKSKNGKTAKDLIVKMGF